MPSFNTGIVENLYTRDSYILNSFDNFYRNSIRPNQAFWYEATSDTRYYAGDASLWNEIYSLLPSNRTNRFNFNHIRRVINMMSGYQRRNRKSTIVIPVENGDEITADQFTKIFMWLNRQEGINNTISDAFEGALVSGLNLLHVWVDYRNDPVNGEIKVTRKAYNEVMMDPYTRKKDLSDCNGISVRSFLTKKECMTLLPDKAEEIENLSGGSNGIDGKYNFMPESYRLSSEYLFSYDEYYYRDYRTQKLLYDTETGDRFEWRSDNEQKLREFMSQHPQITVTETEIPTVRLAILVQGRLMYDGPNPTGDCYPFVPVYCYYTSELPYYEWRLQGVVRGLRDSQYLYNRRKIIELDILESQPNSGFFVKENCVVNPDDLFTSNGQGRVIFLKQEANMADIQQIQAPVIPPTMLDMSNALAAEIMTISGANEELMGSATDDKPGIMGMMRQGAGLTMLQGLYDNLDYAQKLLGKLMIEIIQANFTPGKVRRIIEEEPSPQFYNKLFGKYDAAVEEGFDTTTQKQMEFAQLMQLREIGVPIPDEDLIEAATIQNKKKIRDTIVAKQQKQQQFEQQQQQLMLADQEAKTKLVNAEVTVNTGLGYERLSKMEENRAKAEQSRAQALYDKDRAALEKVKAMVELENLDIDQIQKMLSMVNAIKQQEQAESEHNQAKQLHFLKMLSALGSPEAQQSNNSMGNQNALMEQPMGGL